MSANDNDAGDGAEHDGDGDGQENAADGASNLSLMLAALAGASQSSDASSEYLDAASQQAVADAAAAAQAATENGEAGPVLPGQVGEGETSLDSEQLLALLKSSAGSSAGADANAASGVEDMKVKVAGQETHLALERTSPEVLTALSEAQATAANKSAQDGKTAPALAKAASENAAAATARTRAAETGEKSATSTESGTAKTFGTLAAGDGSVSGALTEQGVSGRESGQGDSRNSNNGNSQQGNSAFVAALNGAAAGATIAVRDAADSADGYEPVSEQIAAGVRAELKADGMGESSSDGVLKVLHIELKPANLGSVTVRIALKDNTVSVHLETQRRDTLAAIDRERDALMSALTSAGYSVDGITTAPQSDTARTAGSTSAFMDNGSSASQGGFQGPFSQGQGLGNSSGGQGRQGQAFTDNQPFSGSDSKDNGGTGVRRGTDALYV